MKLDDSDHLSKDVQGHALDSTESNTDLPSDVVLGDEVDQVSLSGLAFEQVHPDVPCAGSLTLFDASKIRITSQLMSLDVLIRRLQDDRIKMPGQLSGARAWPAARQSRLIESILIRIPLPTFYIDATEDHHWKIIDGFQRLNALLGFVIDKKLKLTQLEFLDLEGYGYTDLPLNLQRRIAETQVSVHFVQEGTPLEVIYNIFRRVNRRGDSLTTQEIREVIHDGQAVQLLQRLASSEAFLRATHRGLEDNLRVAHEVVLRYLAFLVVSEKWPQVLNVEVLMNEAMARLATLSIDEIEQLELRFIRAVNASWFILAEYAFRKIQTNGRPGLISPALFDAWCRNFDELKDAQIIRLLQQEQRSRLIALYTDIFVNDPELLQSVTYCTGDAKQAEYRVEAIRRLIFKVLDS